MVTFKCLLHIGKYAFRNFVSLKIESARTSLTDKATIKLSNPVRKLDGEIKTGDEVKIWLGYDDTMNLEFEGYVSEIKPNHPFEILCEDESYNLKRETVNISWKSIMLADLLKYLVPNVETYDLPEVELKPFRLDYVSKYKALQKIKDDYGFDVYFRNKKLYAGLGLFDASPERHVKYDFQRNIITSKSELVYRTKADIKMKIIAFNITADGKRIEETVGDDGGDTISVPYPGAKDKAALRKLALEDLTKKKFDGYQGEFTTWLLPFVQHGQVADFIDTKYPDRKGSNFIDAVTTEVSVNNGARRKVSPGRRLLV